MSDWLDEDMCCKRCGWNFKHCSCKDRANEPVPGESVGSGCSAPARKGAAVEADVQPTAVNQLAELIDWAAQRRNEAIAKVPIMATRENEVERSYYLGEWSLANEVLCKLKEMADANNASTGSHEDDLDAVG